MIYVLTGDYRQFQSFMQEYRLREDFPGQGCTADSTCIRGQCRRGQVRYLGDRYDRYLRGVDAALVLAWGTWHNRPDAAEIRDFCAARDIPLMEVPDLRRLRHFREMTPTQRKAYRGW